MSGIISTAKAGRFKLMYPAPGSPEELRQFSTLQDRLPDLFRWVTNDNRVEQTILVIPSLSMDPRELAKVSGVHHYEERMLYMLMLLRRARTRVIFVTSQALSPTVADYYLNLLAGIPSGHSRRRLLLFNCGDASKLPLSEKILRRPRLIARIRKAIGDPARAHMVCFNSTPLERTLAVRMGVPLHANDPELNTLGTKSGCREIFRDAGILFPDGFERLRDQNDIAEALNTLYVRYPGIKRAVVKLNEGFSGEGNALFYYDGIDAFDAIERKKQILAQLPNLRFEAPMENWESFHEKYQDMRGIVEQFVEGENKRSPSSQCRVNALGQPVSISTHDQVLGGPTGQVFLGCTFPADPMYRLEIQEAGMCVARALASRGVGGRFATDFVSVPQEDGGFEHYAIEVNLRKGGTTHPFLTLRFLTDGAYSYETGEFYAQDDRPKCYFASDTLQSERYKGLLPEDLIDIAVYHDLHFHASTERGSVFHLMGALSEYGKLGMVCIGDNLQQAQFIYKTAKNVLNQEVTKLEGG
jgi:hypothetical protein